MTDIETKAHGEAEAMELNAKFPVGTKVIYYPGPRSMGGRECTIRRGFGVAPYTGHVVGWVTGTAGYVLASHIEAVPAVQRAETKSEHGWCPACMSQCFVLLGTCRGCGGPADTLPAEQRSEGGG